MNKRFTSLFLLCTLFVACQNTPITKSFKTSVETEAPSSSSALKQRWRDKIRNKVPYDGPIKVILNPGVLNKQSEDQAPVPAKDMSSSLENAFRTQSTSSEKIVFEASFYESGEAIREFSLADITSRYTLVIEKQNGAPEAEININGKDWLKTTDLRPFVKNETLLLQVKNRLRLRLKAKPGEVLSVKIIQGGHAATQNQEKNDSPSSLTQQTREEQNEQNIFEPLNLDSLGDLTPYHQDLVIKETGGGGTKRFSGVRANNGEITRFETGALVLRFSDNELGQAILTNHYNAILVDQLDGFYKFQLDLSQSPVQDIIDLTRYMNVHSEQTVTQMELSSYEALQTLALSLDLMRRFPSLVKSLEFNEMGIPAANFNDTSFEHKSLNNSDFDSTSEPTDEKKNPPAPHNIKDCNESDINSWWLNETNTSKAWDYSIGTGVKVAWLDMGYKLPFVDIEDRRLGFSHGSRNILGDHKSIAGGQTGAASGTYHSLYAMLTGFAERNNSIKTAGVAPNATLWPYAVYTTWDFAKSMRDARQDGVDLIGINYGWSKSGFWGALAFEINEIVSIFTGDSIIQQVELALAANIPVTIAAHNYRQNFAQWKLIDQYSPNGVNDAEDLNGRWGGEIPRNPKLDNLIVVGYATYYAPGTPTTVPCPPRPTGSPAPGPTPLPPALAVFAANNNEVQEDHNGAGSNYANAVVWAPGGEIYVSYINNPQKVARFSGTSAAHPFIAGVVALMKSRNPNLTPQQIQDILLNKAKGTPVVPHPEMVSAGVQPAYMVDVEKAVKAVANVPKAETYFATLFESGSQKTAIFNKSAQLSANNNGGLEQSKQLMDSVSREVWNALRGDKLVKITGWSDSMPNFKAGDQNLYQRFEVLDAEVICDVNNCTNPSAAFDPKLTNVTATKDAAGDIILELQGENLIADVSGNAQVRILLEHMTLPVGFSNAQEELVFLKSGPSRSGEIVEISNKGDYVKLKISKDRLDPSLTAPDPAGFKVRTGSYKIAFRNTITKRNSNFIDNSTGFNISSTTSGGGGILIQSDAPIDPPPGHYVYNQIGNRWIREGDRVKLESNEFAGLYFTKPIRDLTVKVGPVELPVVSVLRDLAVFGIPEDLPAGVHELTVEVDGQTLTLKDAIEKITPAVQPTPEPSPPPSVSPERHEYLRAFNVEGNDEARIYINGQLALTAHAGDNGSVSVGPNSSWPLDTTRPNEIIFEYENRGGGYTLGFKVESWRQRFYHEQGEAGVQNMLNPDGTEDQRQGVVFRERLLIHQTAHPIGSGQLWAKVFNMDDESLQLYTYNYTSDIQWNEDRIATPGKNGEWVKQLPWPVPFYCDGYISSGVFDGCFSLYQLSISRLINPSQKYSYGIEIYRGIHRIYHNVQGQPGGWGARGNDSTLGDIYLYEDVEVPVYGHYPF